LGVEFDLAKRNKKYPSNSKIVKGKQSLAPWFCGSLFCEKAGLWPGSKGVPRKKASAGKVFQPEITPYIRNMRRA